MPILIYVKLAGLAFVAMVLVWLMDEIGDRREAKVRAEIAQQVADANKRADEAHTHWREHYRQAAESNGQALGAVAEELKSKSGVFEASEALRRRLESIKPGTRK